MSSNHQILFRTWTFSDSLFYSVTILTTIGYNNQTPNTSMGKVATILYATFGIPLMLLFVCNVGIMLCDLLQYGYYPKSPLPCSTLNDEVSSDKEFYEASTLMKKDTVVSLRMENANKCCSKDLRHIVVNQTSNERQSSERRRTRYGTIRFQNNCSYCDQDSDFNTNCEWCNEKIQIKEQTMVPQRTHNTAFTTDEKLKSSYSRNFCFAISFIFLILSAYICIGAVIYSAWKNKPFADGAYFCFLTLTTIGSCDIFQNLFLTTNETVESLFYCAYIVVGLTLASAFVLLIQKNVKIEPTYSRLLKFPQIKSDEVAL